MDMEYVGVVFLESSVRHFVVSSKLGWNLIRKYWVNIGFYDPMQCGLYDPGVMEPILGA